jgi:hypothetical protein
MRLPCRGGLTKKKPKSERERHHHRRGPQIGVIEIERIDEVASDHQQDQRSYEVAQGVVEPRSLHRFFGLRVEAELRKANV